MTKKRIKNLSILIAGITILLGVTGCGLKKHIQKSKDVPQFKIGIVLPLTGDAASYGQDCKKGMLLALKQAESNENLKAIFEDSKADPKCAVGSIQKLIHANKVDVILGDMFSTTTLAMAPIAQENGVVLITPTAADRAITATGTKIFTMYPTAEVEGRFVASVAIQNQYKRIGVFVQNIQVAQDMGRAFTNKITANGAELLFYEAFPSATMDFKTLLAKTRIDEADAIFVSAYAKEACNLIRQVRERKVKSVILSQSTLYDKKILLEYGPILEGVMLSAPFFTDKAKSKEIVDFKNAYKKEYDSYPSVWAAYGYDAVNLIRYVRQNSEGHDLAESLRIVHFIGATGPLTFAADRTAKRSLRLFMVKSGSFVEVPFSY